MVKGYIKESIIGLFVVGIPSLIFNVWQLANYFTWFTLFSKSLFVALSFIIGFGIPYFLAVVDYKFKWSYLSAFLIPVILVFANNLWVIIRQGFEDILRTIIINLVLLPIQFGIVAVIILFLIRKIS